MYKVVVLYQSNMLHSAAYRDWIRDIPNPQINVAAYGPIGGVDMNRAQSVVYNETREFLINYYNVTEDTVSFVLLCFEASGFWCHHQLAGQYLRCLLHA